MASQQPVEIDPAELLTLGELENRVRERIPSAKRHQIEYAIDRYRIEPVRRVGIIRVWSPEAVRLVESALKRTASDRRGGI